MQDYMMLHSTQDEIRSDVEKARQAGQASVEVRASHLMASVSDLDLSAGQGCN
jgi:hypothetical protein